MTTSKNPDLMSEEERLNEIAEILAQGYLRILQSRHSSLASSPRPERSCEPRLKTEEMTA